MPGKQTAPEPIKLKIRKNDIVKVIAGRDKGKTGRVLDVNRSTGRVLVEGVMMMKRHTRPNPAKQIKGGIAEKEATIHHSNIMVMTAGGIATRVGMKTVEGGRKVRVARKTGEELK